MEITQQPQELEKKISTNLESLELKNFDVGFSKFRKNQILLNKTSHMVTS
jgi:hypothetical protein